MSFIDNIEIKNFKSIRQAEIKDCRRVNIFIGYPNVGKSNILEAIGLFTFIRQERPSSGLKDLIRFEKFTQIFNYGNIQTPSIINYNEKYSLNIHYKDEKLLGLNLIDNKENDPYYKSNVFWLEVGNERLNTSATNGVDDFSGRFKELQKFDVKPYKFSGEKKFNENISALELNIPNGKNMFEVIINNSELINEFRELLEPYDLDLIIDSSDSDIKISPRMKDGIIHTMPISLMADTLVRLMFFKTAIISNRDSILLFEEPEAHMFPPYIAKFTSDVMYDKNNNQFFMATHSPFVLNDFMEDMANEDLAIYAVGYVNGETTINRLSDKQVTDIYQYGVDLFFNLEEFLKDVVS